MRTHMPKASSPPSAADDRAAGLDRLLRPRSIAICGASPRAESLSQRLLASLEAMGYPGEVHLVNPRYPEIGGRVVHPDVASLGRPVDSAILAVGDAQLEAAFDGVLAAGIPSAVVMGRGQEGYPRPGAPSMLERMGAKARQARVAVCGANCMGYVNRLDGIQLTGMPFRHLGPAGGVALISHSGSTWSGLLGNQRGVGFNFAVSAGQEMATTMAEYIGYMAVQPSTRVIACILETVRDPAAFVAALRDARERAIPIVILKLGRSAAGQAFAKSHTGALSGSAEVHEAVFERHGAISVRSLDELLDTCELFLRARKPPRAGIGVVTDSGGERELIADLAADVGVEFVELHGSTAARLAQSLDPDIVPANPLDYWGNAGSGILLPSLQSVAADPGIGITVLATNMATGRDYAVECSGALEDLKREGAGEVVLMGNIASTLSPVECARLRGGGIPVLMGTETGLRALRHFTRYHFAPTAPSRPSDADPAVVARWTARLAVHGPALLDAASSFSMLAEFGIPLVPWLATDDAGAAVRFAEEAGYPIVAKIDAADLAHKSDVGGVMLGLDTAAAVGQAAAQLQALGYGRKMLLQKQVGGTELIVGMSTDPQFGPVFTLGAGGVFVEVFQDFVLCLPGDAEATILGKLESLKVCKLLRGARGRPQADLPAIASVIATFMDMGMALSGQVEEIEINPLMVDGPSVAAVDALVVLKPKAADA
jgi:acyl-CoA synthetase (NDP forming)